MTAPARQLSIPVIAVSGESTIPGDPVGPRWDEVWSIGGLSRGRATIPLTDVARVLGWDATTAADPVTLLADLRAAVSSTDPRVQTFGQLVAGKSLQNGGADLRDPAVTADQVWLDAATIQLVNWVVARDVLVAVIPVDAVAPGVSTTGGPGQSRPLLTAAGTPCAESLGTADQTSWINWVVNKLGGGVGFGDVSLPGVVDLWVTEATRLTEGAAAAQKAGGRAAAMVGRLNLAASLLSLIAQVNAITVNGVMNPDTLIRHREASDGDKAEVRVDLSFDSSSFDGNDPGFCALSLLSNALGVGLSLPADGAKLSGVEVLVTPGQNFPDRVYFGDSGDLKRVTDQGGSITIVVQGHARPKTLPQTAKERLDEFGLRYAAQVEEVTAQSLLNIFMDGLSLAGGVPSGALDVARTLHFDLGEFAYRFIDYETGYRVDQTWLGGYRLSGEVCDLEQPFVIRADGSAIGAYVGDLTITPAPGGAVSYALVGTFGGFLSGQGSGGGQIDATADPPTLTLTAGSFTAKFPSPIGNAPVGEGGAHFAGAESAPILLVPDPTACGGS